MNKKYELTNEFKFAHNVILKRIRALRDFGNVRAGDLGGWIEKQSNLSPYGDCWVRDDAHVFDRAWICDNADVSMNAVVNDDAHVGGNSRVRGCAIVGEYSQIYGNSLIDGGAVVLGHSQVLGDAHISGSALLYGDVEVGGNALIESQNDILLISCIDSKYYTVTFFRTITGGIWVYCDCFLGSLEEFEKMVEKKHGDNKYGKIYKLAIEMAKVKMNE